MNIAGTVHSISDKEVVSEKLTKREFILKDDSNPQYPQFLRFEAANDKCSLVDGLKIDQSVNVHFNLRGRIAQNGNCYNSLQLWKIE